MRARAWEVEAGAPADVDAAKELLSSSGLPVEGLGQAELWCVKDDAGRLVGLAGLETWGEQGLVRSVVVDGRHRGSGIGRALVERVLDEASSRSLREVYLITETAPEFFARFGFEHVERKKVEGRVLESVEFVDACPDTAPVMKMTI